jgi:hypothetical protein
MSQLYELTTLSFPVLSVSEVSEGARAYVTDANATGELLGCWRTEIGTLGRLLRGRFASKHYTNHAFKFPRVSSGGPCSISGGGVFVKE